MLKTHKIHNSKTYYIQFGQNIKFLYTLSKISLNLFPQNQPSTILSENLCKVRAVLPSF